FGQVLLAAIAHQVHRRDLVRQALEVEADAHAVRGARAPVRVQAQPVGAHPSFSPWHPRDGAETATLACAPPRRKTVRRGRRSIRPARGAQASGLGWRSMRCSMAPKIERPSWSSISIRTVSPNDMKGVTGLPC